MSSSSLSIMGIALCHLLHLASPPPLHSQSLPPLASAWSDPHSTVEHLVSLAIDRAGAPLNRLRRLQRAAQRASWLPDLRLRVRHGRGRDTYRRHDQLNGPPNTSFDEDLHFEMSLSLRLSGLVYPRATTSLARYEAEARRFERQLRERVFTLYFEWLSARCALLSAPVVDHSRRVRITRLAAELRSLTGEMPPSPLDSEERVDVQTRRLCASPVPPNE